MDYVAFGICCLYTFGSLLACGKELNEDDSKAGTLLFRSLAIGYCAVCFGIHIFK